jgi:cysteine synthase A
MTRECLSEAGTVDVDAAVRRMDGLCQLPVLDCGRTPEGYHVRAVYGAPASEASFKAILGLGLLLLARERGDLFPGRPVVESSSGSLGVGLAAAGRVLHHPVHVVTDANVPAASLAKMRALGAITHLVTAPHAVLGFQEARDRELDRLRREHPDWYWTRQNDSDLNPEVYRRWLLPAIAPRLDLSTVAAGVFCVGSGGHFTAFAEHLRLHGIATYVAEREGSVTFGGRPGPSVLRGSGNQNRVPGVIRRAMDLVHGVHRVGDQEAIGAVRDLLVAGISAGGSSGVCLAAVRRLSAELPPPRQRTTILTFLPDRGEMYPTLLDPQE